MRPELIRVRTRGVRLLILSRSEAYAESNYLEFRFLPMKGSAISFL